MMTSMLLRSALDLIVPLFFSIHMFVMSDSIYIYYILYKTNIAIHK